MQVNSLGLTEQQPENNVYRILIEMLSVVLSKEARARAVQLPAWNEALGLPRPFDQQWSLRLQQIMAYETDLLEFGDIFDGSKALEALVAKLKSEAMAKIAAIDAMGGAVKAVETGALKASSSNRTRADSRRSSAASRPSSASTPSPIPSPRRWRRARIRSTSHPRRRSPSKCPGSWRGESSAMRLAWARRFGATQSGGERRQYHARLDRGGQSRGHDGRMGLRAAGGVRNFSRADRRLAARPSGSRRPRPASQRG